MLWKIDKSLGEEASEDKIVTGPLCRACKMLMESKWSYSDGRAMRSRMPDVNTKFVCTNCGNTVKPPDGLVNTYQIKSRVYEFYRAEMRKKEMANKKFVA